MSEEFYVIKGKERLSGIRFESGNFRGDGWRYWERDQNFTIGEYIQWKIRGSKRLSLYSTTDGSWKFKSELEKRVRGHPKGPVR